MTSRTTVTVDIQVLDHGKGLTLPHYATDQAAGMDLEAALPEDEPVTLEPGQRALIPTGIAIALPPGYEAQVRPRSGLALKSGLTVLNAPGTIDADYRGEVGVILANLGTEPYTIERGTRIAQMVIAEYETVGWNVCRTLEETARGAGGFGSTGLKKAG